MATNGPTEDGTVGVSSKGANNIETADSDIVATSEESGEVTTVTMVELATNNVSPPLNNKNSQRSSARADTRMVKGREHVIMINQTGGPTVVSSGGSGHVQHVSVVGHVTPAYDAGNMMGGGSDSDELPSKRKATSFKITNVYLSRPPSNDGEESCDDNEDLEDSHTEDLSDIADSLSSQLETVAALNSGLGGGPHGAGLGLHGGRSGKTASSSDDQEFPFRRQGYRRLSCSTDKDWEQHLSSYSHPGFGFVTYHQTGNTFHPVSYLDKAVSGAVAVFNSMECGEDLLQEGAQPVIAGPEDFKTKFKVVKVETTQPLKRGRWTCIDFTDKQTSAEPSKASANSSSSNGTVQPAQSKPATKTGSEIVNSRPGSTLPRDIAATESSSVITSDSSAAVSSEQTHDQEQLQDNGPAVQAAVAAPAAAKQGVSEVEKENGEAVIKGRQETDNVVRATSAGPDNVRAGQQQSMVPPAGASYPDTATSSNTGLSINLPASVPVITPTPGTAANTGNSVQSPATAGNMQSPHTAAPTAVQQPDYNILQNTIGQVIRLGDGTLAQVALAPLTQQQQALPVQILQQQQQQQQSSSTNQIVHPPSQQHPQQQQQQPQQVMVNNQGQPYLVSQQQQQQNINQVPQQQSSRSQLPQQQQQPQPAGQQQQSNSRPSQPQPQQQQPIRNQQQQQQSVPSNHGVISNATATLPMQQQQQQQPSVVAGTPQQQPQQQQVSAMPPPTAGQQQQATATTSAPVKRQSTSSISGASQPQSASSTQQPRPTSQQQQQQQSSLCQNGVVTVNTINHPSVLASTAPTSQNYFPPSVYGQSVFSAVIDTGYSSVISDGLVERLEDLVSNQFGSEDRDGDLELESASGAGQGSIDHRIEQAMDLVKSHLMTAVRSEVEELRDKISKLEDTVNHLSRENEVLRANVAPEVLTSLIGNRSIMGAMPPDPNSHPALQPPNQH